MLESRWPKGPLIILVLIVPFIWVINPYVRSMIRSAKPYALVPAGPSQISAAEQGPYVVNSLDSLAGGFWHRVGGTDTGLSGKVNGHDEFAAAWLTQMRQNLYGLPVGVFYQSFPTPGFKNDPAKLPGRNIVVIVPGQIHPREALVIGAHYDGEPDSHGSAFDDTSGCSIILGLARVLGSKWRSQGLPSTTVEFILFDSEEQGLFGSGAFLNDLRQSALMPRPVMMIDEEQLGVGYPGRPFGLASRPVMPMFAVTTVVSKYIARLFGPVTPLKRASLNLMRSRLMVARSAVFPELHSVYPGLRLRGGSVSSFKAPDQRMVIIGPTLVCCSDNAPFEVLGLPTVTFAGDFHYYDRNRPSWSYPYDQPQDTPAALSCDTGGFPRPSTALKAALALPVAMSVRIVDDYAPTNRQNTAIAVMGMPAVKNRPTELVAAASQPVKWAFGDGQTGHGASVMHTYTRSGRFTIRVTAGKSRATYAIAVAAVAAREHKPSAIFPPPIIPWHPPELLDVHGCP